MRTTKGLRFSLAYLFLFIGGQALSAAAPVVSAVVNSASFQPGPLAPGGAAAIFGTNLNASASVINCVTGGVAPTTCNGTSVLINGSAVPVLAVSAGQVNFVAPFALTGPTASVVVSSGGVQSNTVNPNVLPASPAIYTQNGSGSGLGLFLTTGFLPITVANPATSGQTVVAYAADLGITNPLAADGTSPSTPVPTAAAVSVSVGNVPAQVLFAGLAPSTVAGTQYQVNFVVPAGLSGNQPVIFRADGVSSPAVTLPLSGSATTLSISTGPNLGTFPLGEDQIQLAASGGTGDYTWAYVSGTMPPGLALRTDVPSWFPTGVGTGLIGIATTPGNYNFTLSVTSGTSNVQQAFSLKITALNMMDDGLPDAFAGSLYMAPNGYRFTALNAAGPVTWTADSGVPAGMTFSSSGVLSGTPTAPGFYNINFHLTDGTDTVYRGIGLNVSAVQITSPGLLPSATQSVAYTPYQLTASGGTGPYTFVVNGCNLPNGLTMSLSGLITGTTNSGPNKYCVNVTVTDSASPSHSYTKDMAMVVLTAPPVPEPVPQIQPYGDLFDCTIGWGCSRGVYATTGGTPPFLWNVTNLPPGMSFRTGSGVTQSWVSPGDVEIWGMPTALGTYNLNVTVTDSKGLTGTGIFPLKVVALGLDTGLSNGTVGTPYASTLRVVGGVPPYTAVSVPSRNSPGALPAGVWLGGLAATGTPQEGGSFNPTFLFTDSASSPANTLTITTYPFFAGAAGTTTVVNPYSTIYVTQGQPSFNFQLGACCNGPYAWSQVGGTLPPGINFTAAGLLTGSPTTAGTYSFLVEAANGADYGLRQITIVVTPVTVLTGYTLPYGNVSVVYPSQTITASGGAGPYTFTVAPGYYLPPGLSLNSATGTISGTPTTVGSYYFTIQVKDSSNPANIALGNFNIDVFTTGSAPALYISTAANFGTYSIGEIQVPLIASGGTGSYTWTLVSGQLPPGLSLRTDKPSWFPNNAAAGLMGLATTPNPTAGASYSFTLQVASGTQSVQQTFTMRITGLTARESLYYRVPDAFVGQTPPYSYQFTALNNAGPVTWTAISGLPPGLTLSSTGLLSGTPTQAGYYNVQYQLFDTVDTVDAYSQWFSINVSTVQVDSPSLLPNATVGTAYTPYTLTASGGTAPYTFTVNGLPSGLTLTGAVISGTVTGGSGPYGFGVTVTDNNKVSYTKPMMIDLIGVPPQEPFVNGNLDDCSLGVSCQRNLRIGNGGAAPFTWNVTGLPPGMNFRYFPAATGNSGTQPNGIEIYGTPLATGPYTVTATATDANGVMATETTTLNVSPLMVDGNDYLPPGTRGTPYSKLLRVLGGTPGYTASIPSDLTPDPVTGLIPFDSGFLPNDLILTGLTVSGTPNENGFFNPLLVFADSNSPGKNTLHIHEGFSIGGGTSTINLGQPTFGYEGGGANNDILGYWTVGANLNYQLGACCVPSYTWSLVSPPASLPPGITLSASGRLGGTFTAAGTYTFLVSAADATNPANFGVVEYTIVVSPLNITTGFTLPYGNVSTAYQGTGYSLTSNIPATFALLPNNLLPPGLTLDSTGLIHGTPTQTGQYYFFVQATDASNDIFVAQFSLSVYANGGYPPLFLGIGPTLNYTVGSFTNALQASGGKPPYYYSFTPGFETSLPGARVQDGPPLPPYFVTTTGALLGVWTTPGKTYNSSLRVTDATGNTFDRPITVNVLPLEVMSQGNLPKGTLGAAYTAYTFAAYGGSGSYSWSATGLPSGMSVNPAGVLSGTPTQSGTFFPSVTVTDNTLQVSNGWGFTLIIDPFAITNGAVLPQGTPNTAYPTQSFNAPGCGSPCTWSIFGGIPSGMTFNAGVLSGTPNGTYNGSFTVQASGPNGTVQKQFGLIVVNPFQPLLINNGSPFGNNTFGNQTTFYLSASGGAPPYTFSIPDPADLPAGMSIQGPGETLAYNLTPGDSYLWGRPLTLGTFNFTLQVTDSAGHVAQKQMSWTITPLNFNYANLPISGTTLVYGAPYNPPTGQPLLVMGGSGNYTSWLPVPSASMPPGLSLNSSTGVITGTPTNTGSWNTQVQVTDDKGNSMLQNINFFMASPTGTTVNIGTGPDVGVWQEGFEATVNLNLSGGTAPYTIGLATGSNPLPPGCALESGSSLLSNGATNSYDLVCTPMATGTYSFTVMAQDSATPPNIGVRTLTIHFSPFTLFTNTTLADGSVGTPYSQTLLVWDNSATPSIAIAPGYSLPPGLLITGNVLQGTPTAAGTYDFSLTATDSSGLTVTYFFNLRISTITITDPQELPQQAIVNVPFTYTFTATGGGASKSWSTTGLPNGFTLSSSGTISGTASNPFRTRLQITVTDGTSTFSRAFTFVARQNTPTELDYSLANTAMTDAVVGQNYAYGLGGDGGVPPYTWSVAAGSSLPPGLNLYGGPVGSPTGGPTVLSPNAVPGNTQIAGAPAAAGAYSFTLVLTDSTGAHTQRTFTLHVASIDVLPGSLPTPMMGQFYQKMLTVVGGTPPYTFSYGPLGISTDMFPPGLNPDATGMISGTPQSTGNYGFKATVTDSTLPTHNTYTVSYNYVVNNNGLWVTTPEFYDTWVGAGVGQGLSTNGNSTYTWTLVSPPTSLPPGVSLSNGVITGVPSVPNTYTFTVRATDTANASNTADRVFTWVVSPMQIFPETTAVFLPAVQVNAAYNYQLQVAGGKPPYVFVESPLYPLPPGMTLSATGLLGGAPTITGSFTLVQNVTDSNGITMKSPGINLQVLPPGQPNPLYVKHSGNNAPATVGVPVWYALDQLVFAGTPPYTWSVLPGPSSSLPPGISILPGGNGISDYIGGAATAAGSYPLTLKVTDAAGQTGLWSVTLQVLPSLSLLDTPLPNGTVGTPYSTSTVIAGGTPPYNVSNNGDLPPGLSLSSGGSLTGTPTYPGLFTMNVLVTDSASPTANSFDVNYAVVIDQDGQAPGLSLGPSSVQLNYTLTAPTPAPTPVSVSTTSGSYPFTLKISGIPGASLSVNNGTTPATVNINLNTAGQVAGTYYGVLAAASPQTANRYTFVPVQLTVVAPPVCAYSLTPNSGSVASTAGGGNSFTVSTTSLCSWAAPTVSDPSWISITAGATGGTGSGTISYTVTQPNPGAAPRTGTITVAGQVYTITQFGSNCSYSISPTSVSISAAATSVPVGVTVSASGCPAWSVTPVAPGVTASPTSGTTNNTVYVNIPANTTAATLSNVLAATIAGTNFTFTQTGVNCTVSLSSSGIDIPVGGAINNSLGVTIPAGCSYTTNPGPSWISVSGGSGSASGSLLYTVAPNTATTSRSATMNVGGAQFQITQDAAACEITGVDASGLPSAFAALGGLAPVTINANGANCSWTASSPVPWARLSQSTGAGSATINVIANSNTSSSSSRSAILTIAGQSVGVTQSGTSCAYTLASTAGGVPASGGSSSVGIITPAACGWTSTSSDTSWLTITSNGNSGSPEVQFTAGANPSSISRSATITINGSNPPFTGTYTVTQAAAPCSFTLSALSSGALSSGGTSGSFTFSTTASGCPLSAMSYNAWITATTTPNPNGVSGTVNYTVAPNPNGTARSGTIQLGGSSYSVTQTGAACAFSLNAYSALFNLGGGTGAVQGSPSAGGCVPTVGTSQPGIVGIGTLSGPVLDIYTLPFTVFPFSSATPAVRRAYITFGGQNYAIKQTSY